MRNAYLLAAVVWISNSLSAYASPIVDGPTETVNLVSISRAKCTLRRDGDPDIVHIFPGGDNQQKWLVSLRFDVRKNHAEIVTTCTRQGFQTRTVTTSFAPLTTTVFGITSTLVRYPGAIIVLLDRK
jgi:hypothetical protein